MKRILVNLVFIMFASVVNAQSTAFNNVYNACIKASDALAKGFADSEQLTSAAHTLRQSAISNLVLKQTKGEKLSVKGHFYFSADFIEARIKDESIYDMAEEYESRNRRTVRGTPKNAVLLTTVVIPAKSTYIYEIGGCYDNVSVACVAETNGLMSWKVTTVEYKSKATKTFKDNHDEKRGRSCRKMTVANNQRYKTVLEITNTGKLASSFAIIAQ